MPLKHLLQCFASDGSSYPQRRGTGATFKGSTENFLENGRVLLEEQISLFDGKTNPVRCFSVSDLNSMKSRKWREFYCGEIHRGVWEGSLVLIKFSKFDESDGFGKYSGHDVAIAAQMSTHSNVLKLVGCCLETKYIVSVYEWPKNGNLDDRITRYKEHNKPPLLWKDRVRIAWEISHAVAYLNTAFLRFIIHRDLKPTNVYLDHDHAAKLTEFSLAISIPEGERHVYLDQVVGSLGYVAPEYMSSRIITESTDVFAFGMLIFVLVTGKPAHSFKESSIFNWARNVMAADCINDGLDPALNTDGISITDDTFQQQMRAVIELALVCTSKEEASRPTMQEVAIRLKNILISISESTPSSRT